MKPLLAAFVLFISPLVALAQGSSWPQPAQGGSAPRPFSFIRQTSASEPQPTAAQPAGGPTLPPFPVVQQPVQSTPSNPQAFPPQPAPILPPFPLAQDPAQAAPILPPFPLAQDAGEAALPNRQAFPPQPARLWPVPTGDAPAGLGSPLPLNGSARAPSVWGGAEYLIWWTKPGPLPTPLVTTGNPTNAVPGALGQPGTRVLFGGPIDYGTNSGGRVTFGAWLDADRTIGLEASGFLFGQQAVGFSTASNAAGNPPIYLPVINQNPASPNFRGQGSYTVADPIFPSPLGPTSGNVAVSSVSRLWGAEGNGVINLARFRTWSLDGLVGFRYLDLQESIRLSGFSNDQFDDIQQSFSDSFGTRNQFYGGQLGARFALQYNRLSLDLTGKVALGATHQTVDTEGSSIYGGAGFALPPGQYPGGVYTQPSNIGRTSADTFTVVPDLCLKLGYDLTPRLRATVGYDFLYWSSVVRPGSQIDHNLNPTQLPGAAFSGEPLPAPQFNRSDFFAHGVSLGLEYRY